MGQFFKKLEFFHVLQLKSQSANEQTKKGARLEEGMCVIYKVTFTSPTMMCIIMMKPPSVTNTFPHVPSRQEKDLIY